MRHMDLEVVLPITSYEDAMGVRVGMDDGAMAVTVGMDQVTA